MQIHHDGALHWVCSSIDAEGQITLYDSLMAGKTSEELDVQLALLYGDGTGDLKIIFAPIQQQRGGADCGLFAAVVCLALATGVDPATIRCKQNRMRTHLSECLTNEILTPFHRTEISLRPRLTSKLTSDYTIKLWCVCHLPSFAFNNMVECLNCLNWFHKPCVGFVDTEQVICCHQCRDN